MAFLPSPCITGNVLRCSLQRLLSTSRCTRSTSRSFTKTMDAKTEKLKQDARSIFAAGVDAALPHRLVAEALHCHGSNLTVGGKQYKVDHNVYIVGFGKAVIGMVGALESTLGEHVQCGVASVPYGIQDALRKAGRSYMLPSSQSKVAIMEGAKDNLPDTDSLRAANKITELTKALGKDDLLIVLVSGGGSALLPSPIPPITLQDIHDVSKTLGSMGSTIDELNTVRKHLSQLKGGRLGRLAYPAQVVSLILSDIIGNQLNMIASGPTIGDNSTPQDCLNIILRLGATESVPRSVVNFFREKVAKATVGEETGSASSSWDHVLNVCIGHNEMAAGAAKSRAEELGFTTVLLTTELSGEAGIVGSMFVDIALYLYCLYKNKIVSSLGQGLAAQFRRGEESLGGSQAALASACKRRSPLCLLSAGETTVTVSGTGKGGRNQEMALTVSTLMKKQPLFKELVRDGFNVVFLSGGTDGQDGPTDAAGALANPQQVILADQSGIDAEAFLRNNDSYSFYRQLNDGKDLLVTGLTGTNVMDIQVLLIVPPDPKL